MVTEQFGKPVGLLNPQRDPSVALMPHVMFVKNIRKNVLKNSQFLPTLTDDFTAKRVSSTKDTKKH